MAETLKINQTQIQQMMKCPEQHRRRFIENEVIPPGGALIRGTAVHVAAEHNFKQKIESRKDLPASQLVEVAVATVDGRIREEGITLDPDERTMGQQAVRDKIQADAIVATKLYAGQIAPRHQPVMVEEKITFKLEGIEAVEIHGTIDTLNEEHRIVDLKTAKKKPNPSDYEEGPQATMYDLLTLLKTGRPTNGVQFEAMVIKKDPEVVTVLVRKRKEDYAALLEQIREMAKAIRAGVAIGSYGGSGAWWCSPKWCGYWSTCKFVPAHRRNEQ